MRLWHAQDMTPPALKDAHSASSVSRGLLYIGLFASSLLTIRLGGLTFGDLCLLLSAAITAATAAARPRIRQDLTVTALLLGLLVAGATLATLRSDDPLGNLIVALRLIFLILVLPWQMTHLLTQRRHLVAAVTSWGLGAAVCSAGTILQFLFGASAVPSGTITNAGRYSGITGHVNDLGAISAIGLALAISAAIRSEPAVRYLWTLIAAACSIGLILSGSVSGLIGVLIAFGVLLLRRTVSLPRLGVFLLLALTVFYSAATLQASTTNALTPSERVEQVLGIRTYVEAGQGVELDTADSRLGTYALGIEGLTSNPFLGKGLDYESGLTSERLQVHNIILASAYQGGILVCLAILIALLRGATRAFKVRAKDVVPEQIVIALTAAIFFAMTGPSLYNRHLWIPIALTCVVSSMSRTGSATEPLGSTPTVVLHEIPNSARPQT